MLNEDTMKAVAVISCVTSEKKCREETSRCICKGQMERKNSLQFLVKEKQGKVI